MSTESTQTTSTNTWNDQYQSDLDHLDDLCDEGKTFEAIEYIATNIFQLYIDFTEDYLMGREAKIENDLSELTTDRNRIEQDFDSCQNGTESENEAAAQDALNVYYNGYTDSAGNYHQSMESLLEEGEESGEFSADFVDNFEMNFVNPSSPSGTIFQGYTDASDLGNCWNSLWNTDAPSDSSDSDDPTSIQPITNSLDSASSELTSQSSIVQSQLQTYESWDEQYESMDHDFFTEIINEENQCNTAMQSAAS